MYRSIFRTAVPAVISLLAFAPAFTQAGEPLVIVVTPSGIEQRVEEANTTLTVIGQETIEKSNASSVAELLRGQAGVHVRDNFGGGNQAVIDLRGFGPSAGNNTLVLVDGRKLNNSADGAAPDLSLINIDEIAQIEILQGSSGVLYGNQAVGGVVNIISKQSFEDGASVGIRTGSYGLSRWTASGNKVLGKNRISGSVSDWRSDNYRDHNESENQRLSLRADRIDNGWTSFIEAEAVNEDINTPGALLQDELDEDRRQSASVYEDDFFKTETRMLRLGLSKVLDAGGTLGFDFAKRDTDRKFTQSFRPSSTFDATQDRDNNLFNASYRVEPMNLGNLRSYIIGFSRDATDYTLDSDFGVQAIDQLIQDIYLSTQWSVGSRSQIDAGVRYSDQQADIDDTFFKDKLDDALTVFSLGFSHAVDAVRLFARADQNFRYPTVEEQSLAVPDDEPGLETQTGVSVEIGMEYRSGQNRIRGTLYQINLENEIAFDSTGFFNLNLDETRRNGFILEGGRQWSSAFETRLSFTLLDAEISDGDFEGNQLPLVPERTLRLDGNYRFNPDLSVGVEIIAVDEQVFGGDFDNQLEKLDAYQVLNAQASYGRDNWTLGFRINNLLNEEYSEAGSVYNSYPSSPPFEPVSEPAYYPSPERNLWVSLKVDF